MRAIHFSVLSFPLVLHAYCCHTACTVAHNQCQLTEDEEKMFNGKSADNQCQLREHEEKMFNELLLRLEPPTGFQMMQKYSTLTHVRNPSTALDSTEDIPHHHDGLHPCPADSLLLPLKMSPRRF